MSAAPITLAERLCEKGHILPKSSGQCPKCRTTCRRGHDLTAEGAIFLDERLCRRCAVCYEVWRKKKDGERTAKSAAVRYTRRGPKIPRAQYSPDNTTELLWLHDQLSMALPFDRQPIRDRIEQLKKAQR